MKIATKARKTRKEQGMHDFHLWINNELMEKIKSKAAEQRRTITAQIHGDLLDLYNTAKQ